MQTLPASALGLIAGCIIVQALVLMAALGAGASSRTVGLQLPYVARSRSTWISGHRAALWLVIPCSAVAVVLALSPDGEMLALGWCFWGIGLVGGALAAILQAARVLRNESG